MGSTIRLDPALRDTGDEAMDATSTTHTAGRTLRDVLVMNYESLTQRLGRKLGNLDLASECLHDAWLRLGDVTVSPGIQSPNAYVYRVACNIAVDWLRSEQPARYVPDGDAELERLVDAAPSPDEAALVNAELEAVEQAFQCLPRRHQTVLLALRIEGQSRQDVARRLRLSLRNVDTTLRQALQHCATQVDRPILAGPGKSRRGLSSRWRRPVADIGHEIRGVG